MVNPLESMSDLPKPIQAIALLASGAGLATVVMAIRSDNPAWKIAAVGLIGLGLILALFKLVLMLRDRAKSNPFASLISRGAGARAGADPASKARMDDLRKKFEEGVGAFKGAGKDLYSLPWFLLVGPSGSGKTEAMRHSNVGFPPGLQDCLQGTGGTLNMHWWFTNHAVVLDTAGRMFMEEAAEGQSSEWKEFLKLLKTARPNCPVNGLLLVISSESLLKDSAEKVERTAGAIARQLDLIQRTLSVRFPVTVLVTKCDKIVGFREFFETVTDPALQHQMLGWSNAAPLDEAFNSEQVEKHLAGVRDRLMKRRAGLLQDPIHTSDANGRRMDEVDELFELPDNLIRIAPRLREYLRLIFSAGEWSPKPLFLRGIYFTSSMREGQALDMTLAAALGVDVESLPGSKEYEKEKAYFIRDVFVGKVFKEKGLVTWASNVGKHLARQRALVVGGSLAATLIIGGVTAVSVLGYRSSLGPPSEFWSKVTPAFREHTTAKPSDDKPAPLALFELPKDGAFKYVGSDKPDKSLDMPDAVRTRSDLIEQTADHTSDVALGWAGTPAGLIVGESGRGYGVKQVQAHRAVVESTTLVPLLQRVREKLQKENDWDPAAVKALAQLVRLHTLAEGGLPDEAPPPKAGTTPKDGWQLVDVAALCEYGLGSEAYQAMDRNELKKLVKAVERAYPQGWPVVDGKADAASEQLFDRSREYAWGVVDNARKRLLEKLANVKPGGDSDLGKLGALCEQLELFDTTETTFEGALAWLSSEGAQNAGEADARNTTSGYDSFAGKYQDKVKDILAARDRVNDAAGKFKPEDLADPGKLLANADAGMRKAITDTLAVLRAQLPAKDSTPAGVTLPPTLVKLAEDLDEKKATSLASQALGAVASQVNATKEKLAKVSYLLVPGKADKDEYRLYEARSSAHRWAGDAVAGAKPVADAAGVAAGFVAAKAKIDDELSGRDQRLTRLATWSGGSLKPDQTKLDRSVSVGKRVCTMAAGRSRGLLIEAAIKDPCWGSAKSVADAAGKVSDALIASDQIERSKRERPAVPLSEMDGKPSEWDRRYLPEAGASMFKAWDDIETMLGAESSGGPLVVARVELAKLPGRDAGRRSVTAYATEYIDYWKGQALNASRPNAKDWDEFSKRIKDLSPGEVIDSLSTLRERCTDALDRLPAKLASKQDLEDAKGDVSSALKNASGKDGREFVKDAVLAKWSSLTSGDAGKAREALVRACREGKLTERYFEGFVKRGKPGHVQYVNDLLLNGMRTLVEASGGELDRAWGRLVAAKGVPLAAGGAGLADLAPADLGSIREAARTVGMSAGKGGGGANCSESIEDRELKGLVSRMMGEGYLSQEGAREWFDKLGRVMALTEKPIRVSVNFRAGPAPKPPTAHVGEAIAAGEDFSRAAMFVGGRGPERLANIGTYLAGEDLTVELPLREPVQIRMWREDPKGDRAKIDNPDKEIILGATAGGSSPWGPLRDFLLDSGDAFAEADGRWSVLTKTADGKYFLYITLSFDKAAGVPARSDWPQAGAWPK